MSVSNEQVLEAISKMSVMDIVNLTKQMEEKFGVSAAVSMMAAPAGVAAAAAPAKEEQTEFDVMLQSFGEKKVEIIKVIRECTGLGLKEAKALVESAPVLVKEGINKADAEKLKKQLEESGATVEIK